MCIRDSVYVDLRDDTKAADVPGIWVKVRNMMADIRGDFPSEFKGFSFNDSFGDVSVSYTHLDVYKRQDQGLLDSAEDWLLPHLGKCRTEADLRALDLTEALRGRLTWEPVSYTHLDVYKRQRWGSGKCHLCWFLPKVIKTNRVLRKRMRPIFLVCCLINGRRVRLIL